MSAVGKLFHIGKKFWITASKPTDLLEYRGRFVLVTDDFHQPQVVEIKNVVGSLAHPTKLQVDTEKQGSFIISTLDFFGQMNGEYYTKEEIALFDETTFEVVAAPPTVKTTPGGIIH